MIKVLKIVGVVSIIFYVVIITLSSIKNHQDGAKGIYNSCKTTHYIILNTLQSSVLVLFCVVGCIILSRINSYKPQNELEQRLHDQNKTKYKNHLWVCLVTFIVVMMVSNLYDIGIYFGKNTGCTRLFRDPSYWWLNQAIWFV